MSPSFNSTIIPLQEVPLDDLMDETGAPSASVLVVDDETLVADTLSTILSRAGFAAKAVYSGAAALDLARKTRPRLLITDVAMPGMNGIELALALAVEQPSCKVLLFSGHATSADLVQALAAGYDFPLLTKPVHPTQILSYVSNLLGRAKEMAVSTLYRANLSRPLQNA